eukprot:PhM_4_TR2400/c1_g1_i1/m.18643/K01490/AMPD; AMP deaminase
MKSNNNNSNQPPPMLNNNVPAALVSGRRQTASTGQNLPRRNTAAGGRRMSGDVGGSHIPIGAAAGGKPGNSIIKDLTLFSTHAHNNVYQRVIVDDDKGGAELQKNVVKITSVLRLRDQYKALDQGQHEVKAMREHEEKVSFGEADPEDTTVWLQDAVVTCTKGIYTWPGMHTDIPALSKFVSDFDAVAAAVDDASCKTTCKHRLNVLEEKHYMYTILNDEIEDSACRFRRSGGVYAHNVKVDNNVGLSTCVIAPALLEYMNNALKNASDEPILKNAHGERTTLKDLCTQLRLPEDLSVLTPEGLGVLPTTHEHLQRIESIGASPTLVGEHPSQLLRAFCDTRTLNEGKFFAQIVKPILSRHDEKKHHTLAAEYRFVIHGGRSDEWKTQARWVRENNVGPYQNAMWVVHVSRDPDKRQNTELFSCRNFQDQLSNIFLPLFEATLHPQAPGNRDVAHMLMQVGAFYVGSEDVVTSSSQKYDKERVPSAYPWKRPPPDVVFHYYLWANVCSLNALRARMGLNTFQFRAACLEGATSDDTLVSSFLLADCITHGIRIVNNAALSYLYYLAQVGMIVSPLANNAVYRPYTLSPFPILFRRGFLVALATCDPLLYHANPESIIEEYGTAMKMFRLSGIDMAEIARNSVWMSSFSHAKKQKWLGENYTSGSIGNSFEKTNVPRVRLSFREENLRAEYEILNTALVGAKSDQRIGLLRAVQYVLASLDASSGEFVSNLLLSATHGTTFEEADNPIPSCRWEVLLENGQIDNTRVFDKNTTGKFPRMHIVGPDDVEEATARASRRIHVALRKRAKYIFHPTRPWEIDDIRSDSLSSAASGATNAPASTIAPSAKDADYTYEALHGVYVRKPKHLMAKWPEKVPTMAEFEIDLEEMEKIRENIAVKALSYRRLRLLEHKFNMHLAMNGVAESGIMARKTVHTDRDFATAHKVDTHVHMDKGFTARQLLNFILTKSTMNAEDIIYEQKGDPVTLGEMLRGLDIKPETLTVDQLNVQNGMESYMERYNPIQKEGLRTVLLSTDNYMGGRYFAELIKLTFDQYKLDEYTFAENRLTIFGKSLNEWDKLAQWFDTHGMASQQNRWMVQIPRNYSTCRTTSPPLVKSFGELIKHLFQPLWSVSMAPNSNPKLAQFLQHVSGFDCVGNEATMDAPLRSDPSEPPVLPHLWTTSEEPPYNYWMFYLWANIRTLNQFRAERDMSTFEFRPHCGETGSISHLVGCFLVADAINHGITLRLDPALEYMYYLSQIGLAISPLSNNGSVLDYLENPFPTFYKRGLNVSLSTDDPLQYHHTQEPLMEEYSIASKIWKLSPNDMCEVARNSVLQSGFTHSWKCAAIGDFYFLHSSRSNDMYKTHLSDFRVAYRYETYHAEIDTLQRFAQSREKFVRVKYLPEEEERFEALAMRRMVAALKSNPTGVLDGALSTAASSAAVPRVGQLAAQRISELQAQLSLVTQRKEEVELSLAKVSKELVDIRTRQEVYAHASSSAHRASISGSAISQVSPIQPVVTVTSQQQSQQQQQQQQTQQQQAQQQQRNRNVSCLKGSDVGSASSGLAGRSVNMSPTASEVSGVTVPKRKWRVFSTGSEVSGTAISEDNSDDDGDGVVVVGSKQQQLNEPARSSRVAAAPMSPGKASGQRVNFEGVEATVGSPQVTVTK